MTLTNMKRPKKLSLLIALVLEIVFFAATASAHTESTLEQKKNQMIVAQNCWSLNLGRGYGSWFVSFRGDGERYETQYSQVSYRYTCFGPPTGGTGYLYYLQYRTRYCIGEIGGPCSRASDWRNTGRSQYTPFF